MYKGQMDAGRVRIIAILGKTRHPALPNVPTAIEQGFPDLVVVSWQAVVAPVGTPAAILDKLENAYQKVTASPEIATQFESLGYFPIFRGQNEMAALLRQETAMWAALIKETKMQLD
jgi:tripartite-type tricarboxylate transporter receptor subunit TctC